MKDQSLGNRCNSPRPRRRLALFFASAIVGAGSFLLVQSVAGIVRGFAYVTADSGSVWKPLSPGHHWQWQLSGVVNETVLDHVSGPKMYDIDSEEATPDLISRLKAKGIYVVCYVESGDWNKQRADAGDYASEILGRTIDGFPDEKYVNINAVDGPPGPTGKTLRDIMTARLDRAQAKGCDGIEPDLDDLHNYKTGFVITQADQGRSTP